MMLYFSDILICDKGESLLSHFFLMMTKVVIREIIIIYYHKTNIMVCCVLSPVLRYFVQHLYLSA